MDTVINCFVEQSKEILKDNLVGVYLHDSAVMGCYNPAKSDIDLIRLSKNTKVICDCHLTVEQADLLSDPSRVVFMIKEPTDLVDDYCNRPDHQGFSDYIHSATDFESAKRTCNETLYSLNAEKYAQIKAGNYFWIERDTKRSVEEAVSLVEKHLGLV